MRFSMRSLVAGLLALLVSTCGVAAEPQSLSLDQLAGRWTGDGRLGFKDGKIENVSCRATYFIEGGDAGLKQSIRCASASGKIEVKTELVDKDGVLTGSWNEAIYNMSGELNGNVTPRGLKVVVKGPDLDANMDLIVRDKKQIVEIQFHNTTLVGLTLILNKSDATAGVQD